MRLSKKWGVVAVVLLVLTFGSSERIAHAYGIAVSAMEGDYLRPLAQLDDPSASEVAAALAGRRVPVSRGYVGRMA